MNPAVTTADLSEFIGRAADRIRSQREALNTLDGKLGDGDIGLSVGAALEGIDRGSLPADLGSALMLCAQAVTRSGGSSFRTLIASGLLAAAKVAKGSSALPYPEVGRLLDAAIVRMSALGKSSIGDKTVLDALDAARGAVEANEDPARLRGEVIEAVGAAMDRMRLLPCRQGRARIYAEKSVGLDDPGMQVIATIVEAL